MVIRAAALFLLLAAPAFAQAASYVVQCTAPCVASDGTTQPQGTDLNRIVAAPAFNPGAGLALVPDTGQPLYTPPAPVVTSLTAQVFLARFTPTEIATGWAKSSTDATNGPAIANGLLLGLTGAPVNLAGCTVTCSDPNVAAFMAAMVASGSITSARAMVIENPAATSP